MAKSKVPYHSALGSGTVEEAQPLDRFELGDSVAFTHDLNDDVNTGLLPVDYDACDLLYAEIPWPAGYKVFNDRAGVGMAPEYKAFLATVGMVVESAPVPVILTAGKAMRRDLPAPTQAFDSLLWGGNCQILVYRTEVKPAESTQDLLAALALAYHRVGDFCCGYGIAGRHFLEAGRSFVMSDLDPKCIGYIAAHAYEWLPR